MSASAFAQMCFARWQRKEIIAIIFMDFYSRKMHSSLVKFENKAFFNVSFLACPFNAVFNDLLIWFVGDFLVELSFHLFIMYEIGKLFKTDSNNVDFSLDS